MADGRVPFGATAANTAAKTADNAATDGQPWNIGPGGSHYWTVLDGMPKPTEQKVADSSDDSMGVAQPPYEPRCDCPLW